MSEVMLTGNEEARIREQVIKSVLSSLELQKPRKEQFTSELSREAHIITKVLIWSKIAVPAIALLAALASSVRTLQTASEIYAASGSHPLGVGIAAVAFTLSAEGALFVLALAREGERLQLSREKKVRHVTSLRSIWRAITVRIGIKEPLRYDQLKHSNQIGTVMLIAFFFAVSANAYLGMRPLLDQIGAVSLQDFVASLWTAPAQLQLTFIVDFAAVLFPPLMALTAGHLTARFATEIASDGNDHADAYEKALLQWQQKYTSPLDTPEGEELLEQYRESKLQAKRKRAEKRSKHQEEDTPLQLSQA